MNSALKSPKVSLGAWAANFINLELGPMLLLGGFSLIMVYQSLLPALPEEKKNISLGIIILGILLLLLGVRIIRFGQAPAWITKVFRRLNQLLNINNTQIVYVVFSAACGFILLLAAGDGNFMRHLPLAILCWILGTTFFVMGVWDGKGLSNVDYRNIAAWMAAFFVVGFALRGIGLESVPKVLTGDESSGGLSAANFVADRMDNIFVLGWYNFPSLYFYLQSIPMEIFGQDVVALRILSAIVGGLTVSAVYLLGRVFYGHTSGVLTAIFMAGFHFHIHFSRLGLNNIMDGLSFVVVLGALWYGWKHNHRMAFLVAGVGLGLSQYFYVSARSLLGLIPLWLIIAGLLDRTKIRKNALNFALMVGAALMVFLPLAGYFNLHQDQFQAPLGRFSILGDWMQREMENKGMSEIEILSEQFKLSFRAFTSERVIQWYNPGVPLLRPIIAGVFMIGLLLLIFRLKESRTYIIIIWLLAFVLIGALSTPVPAAQRYVAAAPVIALVVGFSLGEISKLLIQVWKQRAKLIEITAIVLMIALAVDDARFYFIDFTRERNFSDPNTWVAQALAEHLQSRTDEWQVALYGSPRMGYRSISTLPYLAPHITGYDMNQHFGSPENPIIEGDKIIFVFLPDNEDNLKAAQVEYPNGELDKVYYSDGTFLYWIYEVERDDS